MINIKTYMANKMNKSDENEHGKKKTVSYYKLFRNVDSVDIGLLILMVISSVLLGLVFPINIILFKNIVKIVTNYSSGDNIFDTFKPVIVSYIVFSSCIFVAGFVQMTSIYATTKRQTNRLQIVLYESILRQDITWFSQQGSGGLISIMTDNIEAFQSGIGAKLSHFIIYISSAVGCILITTINGAKLTLYGISVAPLLAISFLIMANYLKVYSIKENEAYSLASSVSEEILSSIKTVFAFNSQEREVSRYIKHLKMAECMAIRKSYVQGLGLGLSNFACFMLGAVIFYNGFHLMVDENLEPGVIVEVFTAMVIGSSAIGFAIPILENFTAATVAAFKIYEITDRIPPIDINKKGKIEPVFNSKIEFKNVWFEYSTRPGVAVLKNFSIVIEPGQTVAIVGPSGSGKSSLISLLQRFYDPVRGEIEVNNVNLKDVDIKWYRSNISVVQQEPPLFSGTIYDNIKLGKLDACDDEIMDASREANAYEFIVKTAMKFNTNLTNKGGNFSGGQKQRIAIARALIRKPKLLLLDEATSALDNQSESIVLNTLDEAIKLHNMTVIVVAHRLTTVRYADRIVVLKDGEIIEDGNHDKLMTLNGWYSEMIRKQTVVVPNLPNEESIFSIFSASESMASTMSEIVIDHDSQQVIIKGKKHHSMMTFYRIMCINGSEKMYIYAGALSAVVAGLGFPIASLIYAQMYKIFSLHKTPKEMLRQGTTYSFLMLLPAILLLFGQFMKHAMFGISGEILTTRLRELVFKSILSQDMEWLDKAENSPGILTSRLAVEASLVKGLSGIRIGLLVEGLTTLITALSIAFLSSWKLTSIMLVFIPMIIVAGIFQGKHASGSTVRYSNPTDANALVLESLNNISVITSLGLQDHFLEIFRDSLLMKEKFNFWSNFKFGLISGVASSALYYSYAAVFYAGSWMIQRNELEMVTMMRVFSILTMSLSALGRTLTLAPDVSCAQVAAIKTLETIDRKPKMKVKHGKIPSEQLLGKIEFNDVYFKYAGHKSQLILKGLSFTVEPGQTVAFVGLSGCGKSTIFQLLERFYDTYQSDTIKNKSPIKIDDVDIRHLNLKWLRDNIGIVNQEPTLFNVSIKDNILYSDRSNKIYDVINAAKMANIHDFIVSLPQAYNTIVGQKGGFLSGGQKQRICIARALLGRPSILILDEATSALDAESEIQVQEAIDKVQKDMTCLIIAHRMSSIKNVDKIFVVNEGSIVESGTHEELMNLNGYYHELCTVHREN